MYIEKYHMHIVNASAINLINLNIIKFYQVNSKSQLRKCIYSIKTYFIFLLEVSLKR